MPTSALFTLYDSALKTTPSSSPERPNILISMEETSVRITAFSKHLFTNEELLDYSTMSPFIPYSIYQSAVMQYRLWKQTGQFEFKENLDSLKNVLDILGRRWMVASKSMVSFGI